MERDYGENFNQPEWIQVDMTYMQKLEENLEYYKTFIKMLESEVDFFDEKEDDATEVIYNIKQYLKELKEVLH